MAFKDVLAVLYDKWKEKHGGGSQDQYGKIYDVSRPTMNLWLHGKSAPTLGTIKSILVDAGYKIEDCIELPDMQRQREEWLVKAERILKRRDKYSERLRDAIEDIQDRIEEQPARASPDSKRRSAS